MQAISTEVYTDLKAKIDAFSVWLDTKRGRNGWACYKPNEVPANLYNPTNEDRQEVEIYEFLHNPPSKYFCYIKKLGSTNEFLATTFVGGEIGRGTLGRHYITPGFRNSGSIRYPVRFKAINGKEYYGTYYASSGDYARVKMVDKRKRNSKVIL